MVARGVPLRSPGAAAAVVGYDYDEGEGREVNGGTAGVNRLKRREEGGGRSDRRTDTTGR